MSSDFMTAQRIQPVTEPTAASAVERRFITGIIGFFGLALLALLWMLSAQITTQYRMTCDRAAATCTLARRHLVGSETYQVRIPSGARAEVRVTPWKSRSSPSTFLELVSASERTFLIEYERNGAGARASAAATRLNAFFAGEGGAVIEEVEGSAWAVRSLLIFLLAVGVGSLLTWRSRRAQGARV